MSSSVATRSCRVPGAEKIPTTKAVPSLLSICLPNKGVGQGPPGTDAKMSVHPSNKQGESFCNYFPYSNQNSTGLRGEVSRVRSQDRVGSPSVDK